MAAKKEIKQFEPGAVILLSNGEYSDYSYDGPFRALKPIRFNAALLAELKTDWKPEHDWSRFGPSDVIGKLTSLGYIEPMESTEIWLGAYSDLDDDAFPAE